MGNQAILAQTTLIVTQHPKATDPVDALLQFSGRPALTVEASVSLRMSSCGLIWELQ